MGRHGGVDGGEGSRYHRQELLPGFGGQARARLASAHAAVVGCGALGCAVADHLARAGVGTLTLVDRDVVEWTNLQRQTLFAEADAREGVPKAEAARRRLEAVNSSIAVRAVIADATPRSVERLLGFGPAGGAAGRDGPEGRGGGPDILLDGTDNFRTRYLLNDVAVKRGVPLVYGGVVGTRGMSMTIVPGVTACLRCLVEDPPPPGSVATCDTAGVLGPVVAIVAGVQATEALKILTGHAGLVSRTLLDMDPWQGQRRRLEVPRRADCPCCGEHDVREGGRAGGRVGASRFEFLDAAEDDAASLCGQDAIQLASPVGVGARVDLGAIAARLGPHGAVTRMGSMLVRAALDREAAEGRAGAVELTVFADGRAIVKGTTRAERARSIYARYVGE